MVPRITSKGKSFKGAGAYFLHDLGKAKSTERVDFVHTVNMLTNDPDKALKVMSWTAQHAAELKEVSGQKATGRKAQNPVYTYCLAWAPDQNPEREHMVEFGMQSLEVLGVSEHEALFIAHNDTEHKHLHIIVNRVHPVTGLMAGMNKDRIVLSRLAQHYEENTGQIYCHERVMNNRARDLGDYVKADKTERLMNTPDYQKRRSDRLVAQRQAVALAAQRCQDVGRKEELVCDLKAEFDRKASQDDQQCSPKSLRLEPQREGGRGEQGQPVQRQNDKQLVEAEEQRTRSWADYEATKWQVLNDKQTAQREGAREKHANFLSCYEKRLDKKYFSAEKLAQDRIDQLAQDLAPTAKGRAMLVNWFTGQQEQREKVLENARDGQAQLQAQKERERTDYLRKQEQQREALAQRHERERERLAAQLTATKAKQDMAFEKQEAQQLLEKSYIKAVGERREHNIQISEYDGHAAWRRSDKEQGYGR